MTESRNPLLELRELGQSPWCDALSRPLLESGELERLISQGIVGVTSNPTIFQQAIGSGEGYDAPIADLLRAGRPEPAEMYERLAVADIRAAADLLLPVYEATEAEDGNVSLEVSPEVAHDAAATVAEGWRLWRDVDRPNLMIKVPGTEPGLVALSDLLEEGINVNVTLLFGLERYRRTLAAHASGLLRARARRRDVRRIASVASFFVSRVDTLVDRLIEVEIDALPPGSGDAGELRALLGRVAIINASAAYDTWARWMRSEAMVRSLEAGGRPQRLLWASTSTKNPTYPDLMYVDGLIGTGTVTTMPLDTIARFLDHGRAAAPTLIDTGGRSEAALARMAELNIDMDRVAHALETQGIRLFAASHRELLEGLRQRAYELAVGPW